MADFSTTRAIRKLSQSIQNNELVKIHNGSVKEDQNEVWEENEKSDPESGEVEDLAGDDQEKELSSKPIAYSSINAGDFSNLAGRASAIRAIITRCRLSSGWCKCLNYCIN